jgi:hypothetical protein
VSAEYACFRAGLVRPRSTSSGVIMSDETERAQEHAQMIGDAHDSDNQ